MLPEDLALLPKRPRTGTAEVHLTYRLLKGIREQDKSFSPPEEKNSEAMVARICRTAMLTKNPWYIRPWIVHCSAQNLDLTSIALLIFNLCLSEENRFIPVFHPFLWDVEEKGFWSRRILRGLFQELCRTDLLPCNPVYKDPCSPTYKDFSLLHLVASSIVDVVQTTPHSTAGTSIPFRGKRNPSFDLPRGARKDYNAAVFAAKSIVKYGGDLYIRDKDNDSVTDYFREFDLLPVWEDILLASGLFPALVFEEDRRRKEGITAAATTHDYKGRSLLNLRASKGLRRRTITAA